MHALWIQAWSDVVRIAVASGSVQARPTRAGPDVRMSHRSALSQPARPAPARDDRASDRIPRRRRGPGTVPQRSDGPDGPQPEGADEGDPLRLLTVEPVSET